MMVRYCHRVAVSGYETADDAGADDIIIEFVGLFGLCSGFGLRGVCRGLCCWEVRIRAFGCKDPKPQA